MPENTITFQAHIAEFSLELDLPNNLIFFSTFSWSLVTVSYTHLRAHETREERVWRGVS